ncbi:MAG: hypothetical protein EBZ03_08650 [Betaproteobacteria bacterium]|mgnify:CR=1 FL=1|nr:hypothetical protein [Betaproteobacteria bacterium]NBP11596.1 hypothetical protein [Betaproteobacteria bacterium]NBP36502.1 hypothetical protein [Betaproteobacteria bacterium]NBQ10260.1 hypothetical protein [Betaproteobacteria bacterium]NBQ96126.1 hypothetical protein [Betaproteobacteria bacterium]
MDAGTTLRSIAPLLIPIFALSIPIVAIIWSYRSRMHQSTLLHETIRHLSDHGHPIPQSLLDQLKQLHMPKSERNWSPRSSMRVGVMHVAVGAALTLFFLAMRPDNWLWAIGVIPLFIGIGLVFIARTESRAGLDAVSPPSKQEQGAS